METLPYVARWFGLDDSEDKKQVVVSAMSRHIDPMAMLRLMATLSEG